MFSKLVMLVAFILSLNFITTAQANVTECRIKLVPKMDLYILLIGYKSKWQVIENKSKLSECVKAGEEKLASANNREPAKSLEDLITRIILAIFEPEYFKAIKIQYTDEAGKKSKVKIKYTKPNPA